MKKFLGMMLGVLAAAVASAAQNDLRVTFRSVGPDTYKDGTAVLNGEFYALVWTAAGQTFPGFQADGSLAAGTGSELIVSVPHASRGKCAFTAHQIPAADAGKYADGAFALYLLDTRNADGSLAAAVDGKPAAVNGYEKVAEATGVNGAFSSSLAAASAIQVETVSAVPRGAPQPAISGVAVVEQDGRRVVQVKVKNTVPYLRYNVAAGETPAAIGRTPAARAPQNGGASAADEIVIEVPAENGGDKAGFFKVIRN